MDLNKEEILEKSRKQNKNKDPFEQQVIAEGNTKAYAIGLFIASMLYFIEAWNNSVNYSVFAVWMSMDCTLYIYKYIKLKRKYELAMGIFFGICAIMSITMQVLKVFKVI